MVKDKKKKTTAKKSGVSKELKSIGGALLKKMALGGAARLRSKSDEVNKLNVFPVPDGDTGDNMRMTIESGIAAVENMDSDDIASVMKAISHGMLLGARGNSGVILSQFFSGLSKGLDKSKKGLFSNPFFLLTFELFSLRGVLALRIKHPPSPLYKGDEVLDDIFCLY
jgi:hypothetical protein